MTDRILTTERLVMSPVSTDDFDALLTLWSDEDFTRHIMGRALGRALLQTDPIFGDLSCRE
ncbi:hypothetical protein [Brevundimonas sp. 'scallop']|uniref:hypothetical protein n=1 Tax=Brevundimonas sp. 'scallop' TaxID=2562582 RepID=UPI00197AB951|nr:hypothetical protein [Brevundimonas sp. 'scallop']